MRVGALNIQAPEWDEWYPEDLPEEWRLHYFAGEYRAVFLPRETWLAWDDDLVQEIDWPDHLAVFVEVNADDVSRWEVVRGLWAERHSPIVLSRDASLLKHIELNAALIVEADSGWAAETAAGVVSAIECDVNDLKMLRRHIENSAAWAAEDGVLLFGGSPEQLESANTLTQLLV